MSWSASPSIIERPALTALNFEAEAMKLSYNLYMKIIYIIYIISTYDDGNHILKRMSYLFHTVQ